MGKMEKKLGRKLHRDKRSMTEVVQRPRPGQNNQEFMGTIEWTETRRRRLMFKAKNKTELERWRELALRRVEQIPSALKRGYLLDYQLGLHGSLIKSITISEVESS